ncbi:MAG TPA: chromosome segregation protein SMC, partial [Pseudonocardia sp.]
AVAEQEEVLVEGVATARRTLAEISEARTSHERTLAAAERAHLAAVRALADRRAGLATLAGRAEALRSGAAATAEEIERLSDALAEAQERTAAAAAELEVARAETVDVEESRVLDRRSAEAAEAHDGARARVAELVAQEREAEQRRAHWRARVDALSVGLARRDGSAALLQGATEGVLGTVPALVTVQPWARAAVAAVLGELADAVVVAGPAAAADALYLLRARDAGRAALLVAPAAAQESAGRPDVARSEVGGIPIRWVADAIGGGLAGPVGALLEGVALVDDIDAARLLVAADPSLTAVTAEGDVLAADRARGGSGTASSGLDVQAAVNEAVEARDAVEAELASLRPTLEGARSEEAARLADLDALRREQQLAGQRRAASSAQLTRFEQVVHSATAEAERLRTRRDQVESKRSDALLALEAAERQLAVAEDEPVDDEPDTEIRDAAAVAVETARSDEVEARLALRTAEERARAIAGRADSLRRQAAAERQARQRAAAAHAARERGARIAALVVEAGETAGARIAESLTLAAAERDGAAAARDSRERELGEARLTAGRLTAP